MTKETHSDEEAAIRRKLEAERESLEGWICNFTSNEKPDKDRLVDIIFRDDVDFYQTRPSNSSNWCFDVNGTKENPFPGDIVKWRYSKID